MKRIKFDEQFFEIDPNETVLQSLLRNNMQVPYGCKAGGMSKLFNALS